MREASEHLLIGALLVAVAVQTAAACTSTSVTTAGSTVDGTASPSDATATVAPPASLAAFAGRFKKDYGIGCAIGDDPPSTDKPPAFNFPKPPFQCGEGSPWLRVSSLAIDRDRFEVTLPQPRSTCTGRASIASVLSTTEALVVLDDVTCDGEPAPRTEARLRIEGDSLFVDTERFYREGTADPTGGSPPVATALGSTSTAAQSGATALSAGARAIR